MRATNTEKAMWKPTLCILLLLGVRCNEARDVEVGEICGEEILNTIDCEKVIDLDCPAEEQQIYIKFTNAQLVPGTFIGDKFTAKLKVKCSSSQPKTFHEIQVKTITFPNTDSNVKIGDGTIYGESEFYNYREDDDEVQFTIKDDYWIVIETIVTQDPYQEPNITIQTTSVPNTKHELVAEETGIKTKDLTRNAEYIWTIPSLHTSGIYRYLTADFVNINLTTDGGDLLVVSGDEPLKSETIILPYNANNVTLQIRDDNAKIRLEVGRHILPITIGFQVVFEFNNPITTSTRSPPTTTTKPPLNLNFTDIVVVGWELAQLMNEVVIEDVKTDLNTIINCYLQAESTKYYQIFLSNQTTCSHSWTVSYYNCTQVKTGTPDLSLADYRRALGDKTCRQKAKYTIRFPEEMFDFYNMVAIPIAAVSLAIIVIAILAIWRGSVAIYYQRQLKARKSYEATPSGDSKDDPWSKGKNGQYNEAFEAVEDDDDVIFDPTIDGSVYSRYSSISTATGPSTFVDEDEPTRVTYTSGRLSRPRSTDSPASSSTQHQTEVVQHLQLKRLSTASTHVSTTDL